MFIFIKHHKGDVLFSAVARLIVCVLSLSLVFNPAVGYAQVGTGLKPVPTFLNLPLPGTMVTPSPAFVPVLLKGMTIHPDDPLRFDFIIDSGNSQFTADEVKKESERLVKYFLAAMTVPKDDLWVNLSPYEQERIIPDELGKTELGRDMLAQDYILKQLTASLMYPEEELGKKFWDKVYREAKEKFGTSEIPVNTFNKVWIVPETATVYEHGQTVYVVDARLRVMLDADYVAMESQQDDTATPQASARGQSLLAAKQHSKSVARDSSLGEENGIRATSNEQPATNIIREIILPAIEREVNEGEHFAPLRQIYHSLILAKWYKETVKNSLLSRVYVDQNKIAGVDTDDPALKDKIYAQYMEAYKKGVFNYIKEDYVAMDFQQKSTATPYAPAEGDRLSRETIPRKYFSGGIDRLTNVALKKTSSPVIKPVGPQYRAEVGVSPEGGKNGALERLGKISKTVAALAIAGTLVCNGAGCAYSTYSKSINFDRFNKSTQLTQNDKDKINTFANMARFTYDDAEYLSALNQLISYGASAKGAIPYLFVNNLEYVSPTKEVEVSRRWVFPEDRDYGSWYRCYPYCRPRLEITKTEVDKPDAARIRAREKMLEDKFFEALNAIGPSKEYTSEELVIFLDPWLGKEWDVLKEKSWKKLYTGDKESYLSKEDIDLALAKRDHIVRKFKFTLWLRLTSVDDIKDIIRAKAMMLLMDRLNESDLIIPLSKEAMQGKKNVNDYLYLLRFFEENRSTALIQGALNGRTTIVRALLNKGADVNVQDKDGQTALIAAADKGYTEIVQTLLDKDANVNVQDKNGRTALFFAARGGHTEIIQALLNQGANVNVQDKNGITALDAARQGRHNNIYFILLNAKAKKGSSSSPIEIKEAISGIDTDWANLPKKDDGFSRILAGWKNDVLSLTKASKTARALALSAAITCTGAGCTFSQDVFERISPPRGIIIKNPKAIPLSFYLAGPIIDGNLSDVISIVRSKYVTKDELSKSLIFAIEARLYRKHSMDNNIISFIIDQGADVNVKNKEGATALMLASKSGLEGAVRKLLDKRAEVNIKDSNGKTALMYATGPGFGLEDSNPIIVEILLAKGAQVNARDNQGRTALDYANKYNNHIAKILLKAGAKEGKGSSPVDSRAAEQGTGYASRDTNDEPGGIDMNDINVDRQGAGVDIQFDPVEIQEIIDMGIDGFAPVIINITPLPSVLPLLGLAPNKEEELEVSSLN